MAWQQLILGTESCGGSSRAGLRSGSKRDSGLSTKVDAPVPDMRRALFGLRFDAPYLLEDMADDAFGLLDHLGIEAAHVVGASLGGMIAQTMAIKRPERVLSLTSIMSTTGERRAGRPKLRVMGV